MQVVTGDCGGTVSVWNAATGSFVSSFRAIQGASKQGVTVTDAASQAVKSRLMQAPTLLVQTAAAGTHCC
jgi:hypothetical protein